MSTTSPRPASPTPTVTIVVLPLAALPYAVMMSNFGNLHDVDGISRGLAGFFIVAAMVVLWIMLAVLLLNAAVAGVMPSWARIAALALHPASFAAAVVALRLLDADRGHEWVILTPALLPPLIGAYALWARLPRLHTAFPPTPVSAVVWGMVLVLSAAPLAGQIGR